MSAGLDMREIHERLNFIRQIAAAEVRAFGPILPGTLLRIRDVVAEVEAARLIDRAMRGLMVRGER